MKLSILNEIILILQYQLIGQQQLIYGNGNEFIGKSATKTAFNF